MYNIWIINKYIAGRLYWQCDACKSIIPYTDNAMNFCGHCGEPKYYLYTEQDLEAIKKQEYS